MSYSEIIEFRDGKADTRTMFANAFSGSAWIWEVIAKRYLPEWNMLFASPGLNRAFWALARDKIIPLYIRATFAWTFDRAIVKQADFKLLGRHLREFNMEFPKRRGTTHYTTSLPAFADFIEASTAEALGFRGTSVAECLWFDYDEEADGVTPYDLNTRAQHFEIYPWLRSEGA